MLSRLSLTLAGRLWAALLALTVLTHATAPFDAPMAVRSGSAFSAVTADLAVAPERRVQVQRAMLPVAPPPLIRLPEPESFVLAGQPRAWPPQTAPPVAAPLLLRPAPTGPPLA